MSVSGAILATRFGLGLAPGQRVPEGPDALLAPLSQQDSMARRFPIARYSDVAPDAIRMRQMNRAQMATKGDVTKAIEDQRKRLADQQWRRRSRDVMALLARAAETEDPLRERLTRFWADHFTVVGKHAFLRTMVGNYVEEAIRPHLTGRFADLLRAAVLHPMMLVYLDQAQAIGPNSMAGRKNPDRGLNENLARELLELHTLGVGSVYTQKDVAQLAELLAGLSVRPTGEAFFAPRRGEPGPEQILGRYYGQGQPTRDDIHAMMEDLARHPDTARHIARKLAVHFVSDAPEDDLVTHVAERFLASDGALLEVYSALLEHPAAMREARVKVKQPWDYIATAVRAVGVSGQALARLPQANIRPFFLRPLAQMGQRWERPTGPDGWPEDASHWISPQGLAGRINWAMRVPDMLDIVRAPLPDPRELVDAALGPLAGADVRFAARAAETREEGVSLVLLSPEFQRR